MLPLSKVLHELPLGGADTRSATERVQFFSLFRAEIASFFRLYRKKIVVGYNKSKIVLPIAKKSRFGKKYDLLQ